MTHQWDAVVGKVNQTLVCISQCISSKTRNISLSLYSALVMPQLKYCMQFWAPHLRRNAQNLERVQRRATPLIQGLEGRPHKERLLGLFSLEKRRLRGDWLQPFCSWVLHLHVCLGPQHVEPGRSSPGLTGNLGVSLQAWGCSNPAHRAAEGLAEA